MSEPRAVTDGEQRRSRKNPVPKEGHLPVSEFLGELQGAASPFGDDLVFPLSVDRLAYVHPDPKAPSGAA